jgi:hypothetical protein
MACGGLTSLVDGVKVEGDAVWERHRVDEKFGPALSPSPAATAGPVVRRASGPSPTDVGGRAGEGLDLVTGRCAEPRECGLLRRQVDDRYADDARLTALWAGRPAAPRRLPPPHRPCVRFSRTRLSDIVHRLANASMGLTVPLSRYTPSWVVHW